MAVLKHTSPTASPTAPTPIPCRTVPLASTSTPVTPGSRSRLMGGGPSGWANGALGSDNRRGGQCGGSAMAYIDPDREAWQIFKDLPRDQPIQMLNLIRL